MIYNVKFYPKGSLSNYDLGLRLDFQYNPVGLEYSKPLSFSESNPTGLDFTRLSWVSGGSTVIPMVLIFDRRAQYEKAEDEETDTIGVMDIIATLNSFATPVDLLSKNLSKYSSYLGGMKDSLAKVSSKTRSVYTAPPECVFTYGNRMFRARMKSLSIRETNHNTRLIPIRIEASVELHIYEQGTIESRTTANDIYYTSSFNL